MGSSAGPASILRSGLVGALLAGLFATLPAAPATARPGTPTTGPPKITPEVASALTDAQRVGQLFMVGVNSAAPPSAAQLDMLRSYAIGNVMLTGRSDAGTSAVRAITARLRSATTQGLLRPFVATDQEGGYVQVLTGPGFSTVPTALTQGSWSTATLRADARTWGSQLTAAGVNLNLAPVLDTVPAGNPTANQPIGRYYREYGYTPGAVTASGTAFLQGMRAAGEGTAIKHFPGLGRATGNTDVTAGVTDPTTRFDPYLQPFAAGVAAGSPFVMVSTARYPNIDAQHLAAFSPTVLGTMLRGDLHFPGVVISDDLGNAASVAGIAPGTRAVDFFAAGGDLLLTVNASVVPAMVSAVESAMRSSPTFAARIDAALGRVLQAKTTARLSPPTPGDFTGDGVADPAVFRPSTGTWYVRGWGSVRYGVSGDVPVPADFTGDGRADIAMWRPATGTWYVRGVGAIRYGVRGDVPVPADFTGDGRADIAMWRPATGTWYVRGVGAIRYGVRGDVPVPADFTGDGRADIAMWRPATGTWYVRGVGAIRYGVRGDVPVPADFTGDGRADIAMWRPATGTWYVRGVLTEVYGVHGDMPTPANYAADGRADVAVWRPANGTWYVNGVSPLHYGQRGDIPVR